MWIERRRNLASAAAGTWLCAALLACNKGPTSSESTDSPASGTPSASAPVDAAPAPPASSAAAPSDPMQLLQFEFTSEVKGKEPADHLDAAEPGMRVYAHLKLRNRWSDTRVVHLAFKVNGETRTTMDLNVEPSWSYRTWAYNTLRKGDKTGELTLTVTDDSGATLVERALPIRAKAVKKPLGK